jgi:Protein of unknown function (DUF3102)
MTGPLKADKKAASLVPQINKVHAQLVEAETEGFRQSLAFAIELGVLLNLAKEAVYHGHFEEWFEQQDFGFSYRSARRYMRFAKNRETLEAEANWPRVAKMAGEGDLSIRAAEALLKSPPPDDGDSDSDDEDNEKDEDKTNNSPQNLGPLRGLLPKEERFAVADHTVALLKERGDPWRLNEEAPTAKPPEFEQSLGSLEQGLLLTGSAIGGTEGIPPNAPHPAFRPLEPPVSLQGWNTYQSKVVR